MRCGFSMMESESSEYVDAYADWVELKAALKRKGEELLTKKKEVEEMLKQGTQAAERVKMLEKEVEEGNISFKLLFLFLIYLCFFGLPPPLMFFLLPLAYLSLQLPNLLL